MRSDLILRERDSTAPPAFDILIGMRRGPFCKFGLRPHQTLHRRNIGKYEATFTALVRCRGEARNKQEFYHSSGLPLICFVSSSLPHPIRNTVNSTLSLQSRDGERAAPTSLAPTK